MAGPNVIFGVKFMIASEFMIAPPYEQAQRVVRLLFSLLLANVGAKSFLELTPD
jgi:hypothetical protein